MDRKEWIQQRAKELRRKMTPPEVYLWNNIRPRILKNPKFRRQYVIADRYITDFYCPEANLVVEVNGAAIHDNQIEEDAARQQFIVSMGYRMIRIPAFRILEDSEGVADWLIETTRKIIAEPNTWDQQHTSGSETES